MVGAIAGYPLIKNCINQGFDAIEYINGNLDLASVDEPLLAAKFESLPVQHTVEAWLALIPKAIDLLSPLSPLQLRDFLLETSMRHAKTGEVIFEKGAAGSSVFAVFSGGIKILIETGEDVLEIPMSAGQMFGEVGLISGRPRGSTVVSSESTILLEIPRTALLGAAIAGTPAWQLKQSHARNTAILKVKRDLSSTGMSRLEDLMLMAAVNDKPWALRPA